MGEGIPDGLVRFNQVRKLRSREITDDPSQVVFTDPWIDALDCPLKTVLENHVLVGGAFIGLIRGEFGTLKVYPSQ